MQEQQAFRINDISESTSNQGGIRMLNFDTSTYHFSDIDLATAIKRLQVRDREMLILRLMGHNQNDIALVLNLTRSMISKRLTKITKTLSIFMK